MNNIIGSFIYVIRKNHFERTYSYAAILGRNLSFKSDLSLDKIYPNSRLQLYTPPPVMFITLAKNNIISLGDQLNILYLQPVNQKDAFSGYIPINKLQITYSRSSGPGGQHVNTVNTKVDLRFKLSEAEWIPEKTRNKLLNGVISAEYSGVKHFLIFSVF